jgi:hypothetical protein
MRLNSDFNAGNFVAGAAGLAGLFVSAAFAGAASARRPRSVPLDRSALGRLRAATAELAVLRAARRRPRREADLDVATAEAYAALTRARRAASRT